jgi:hypothetical protein
MSLNPPFFRETFMKSLLVSCWVNGYVTVATLAGCSAHTEPATHMQAPPAVPQRDPSEAPESAAGQAPIAGRLIAPEGVPVPGSEVVLRWVVEQRGNFGVPLDVTVRAPSGVSVRGDTQAHLGAAVGVREGTLRVTFASIPAEDLVVVVHGREDHAGYHQELAYRFGRPEPVVQEPTRSPVPARVGGRILGRPVRADQRAQ